ncbi:MAG TPA: prolyl oligopeptidase family serine peptidase [Candidatus Acidoferrales bacterium]|nr:prolyl oligopeptidase family serine peptidase [Candidatus Acidoferrales bacterium]
MRKSAFALLAAIVLFGASPLNYPPTPKHPVVDTYFGTRVVDPYRWLENPNDPAVKAWAHAQAKLAENFIDSRRSYAFYSKRVPRLSLASTARFALHIAGERMIYLRETPPQAQAQLIARDGLKGPERVLFDPATAGSPAPAIESIFVSPDGSKVAFTTQPGGSEAEVMHVVDAATGQMLSDTIEHVGGGLSPTNLMWDADGKGFIHTQWPQNADGSYATSGILLYHHVLGTDASSDTYVFGKGLSPRAEYSGLLTSKDGAEQAILVAAGDGVAASIYMRASGDAQFRRVADPRADIGDSADPKSTFVGHSLYVISKSRDSRGSVVAIAPGGTFASGTTIVPASGVVIDALQAVRGGFITSDINGGDAAARFFSADGKRSKQIPIPAVSVINTLAADPAGGPIIIGYQGYTTPTRWLRYVPQTNQLLSTGIVRTSPGDFSNVAVKRVFVPSLDGQVRIPLEITYMRNIPHDGTAPTILTAYGAYGFISTPFFLGSELAWLERGGVFAQAMIRGGGAYGDAWHLAAVHATKTKSSDDVAACAEWLGAHGFGNAQHIGIEGGSAGGFLMGLALTRNPRDYRAVVAHVGVYDLLRVELTPNGAFNTPEFGTVKDPKQFAWMIKQSPYHNVHNGTAYPAVLFMTGENDPRVDPYNSRKMAARLQAASSSPYPILLLQQSGRGHGIGSAFGQFVVERIDVLTFFESQLR